jgi:uncharacterized protein YkwD
MRNLILALLLLCAGLLAGCPGGDDTGTPDPGVNITTEIQTMLTRHNNTRASLGLAAYTIDNRLSTIAQQQADYMLAASDLTHVDAQGGSVGDRATTVGYPWTTVGENIARTASGTAAYEAWLASSGHYANITSPDFAEAGIGLATAGSVQYWCVVFGHE